MMIYVNGGQINSNGNATIASYPLFNQQASVKIEYACATKNQIDILNNQVDILNDQVDILDTKIDNQVDILDTKIDILDESAGPLLYTKTKEAITVINDSLTTVPLLSFSISLPVIQKEQIDID